MRMVTGLARCTCAWPPCLAGHARCACATTKSCRPPATRLLPTAGGLPAPQRGARHGGGDRRHHRHVWRRRLRACGRWALPVRGHRPPHQCGRLREGKLSGGSCAGTSPDFRGRYSSYLLDQTRIFYYNSSLPVPSTFALQQTKRLVPPVNSLPRQLCQRASANAQRRRAVHANSPSYLPTLLLVCKRGRSLSPADSGQGRRRPRGGRWRAALGPGDRAGLSLSLTRLHCPSRHCPSRSGALVGLGVGGGCTRHGSHCSRSLAVGTLPGASERVPALGARLWVAPEASEAGVLPSLAERTASGLHRPHHVHWDPGFRGQRRQGQPDSPPPCSVPCSARW